MNLLVAEDLLLSVSAIQTTKGSISEALKGLQKEEGTNGIEIIKVDGVLGIPNKCYNDLMYKKIQEKFGKDAFNKAME